MLATGNGSAEVAHRAQQLLEHSLLSELRAIVARALSGLDMFAGGQLSELDLLGSDFLEGPPPADVRSSCPLSPLWNHTCCNSAS
jgi:hypothetical protein